MSDGAARPGDPGAYPTSSTSMPSIVATMLHEARIEPGADVLEIGTGTGWNTGLLAARLGAERVTSIEVDPAVADTARRNLADAGLTPTVITGDGAEGYPANAPYDRILGTCAVQHVPHQWVAQCRPGALIVTPWGNAYHNGTLTHLTVRPDGGASGPFGGNAAFMWMRAQRVQRGWSADNAPDNLDAPDEPTTVNPWDVIHDFDAGFAVGLHLPEIHNTTYDGADTEHWYEAWFWHPESGSVAQVIATAPADYVARQVGPRRLWDEIEAAHLWWLERGKPEHTRFGLTVTPDRQWTWLDTPDHPVPA